MEKYFGGNFGYVMGKESSRDPEKYLLGPIEIENEIKNFEWHGLNNELPYPSIQEHIGLVDKDYYYLIGGENNDRALKILYRYDITEEYWTELSSAPFYLRNSAGAIWENKIYVFGGTDSSNSNAHNHLLEYDIELDIWTELFPTGSAPMPRVKHDMVAINGKLYIGFGADYTSEDHFNNIYDIWSYDIENNSWTQEAENLDISSYFTTQGRLDYYGDNLYYLVSSHTGYNYPNILFKFDLENHSWTNVGEILYPRIDFEISIYENKLYIYGNNSSTDPIMEIYDLDTNISEEFPIDDLGYSRQQGSFGEIENGIFMLCGGKNLRDFRMLDLRLRDYTLWVPVL